MKKIVVFAACAASLMALQSCAFLDPAQRQLAVDAVQKLVSDGVLTVEQGAALKSSLGGGTWTEIVGGIGVFTGSVISSLLGVRLWRGSTMNRAGLAPQTQVVKAPGA